MSLPRKGFIVWESSRSGHWRIFQKSFHDDNVVQVSHEEPSRDHFGAHVSPDGTRLVYLSYPQGLNGYKKHPANVEIPLWIAQLEGNSDPRILIPNARPYGEHRSVVWLSNDKLAFINADYQTCIFNLNTGETDVFIQSGPETDTWNHGFLPSPDLTRVTTGLPQIFEYRGVDQRPRLTDSFHGCQPLFTSDANWFYWTGQMGGPLLAKKSGDSEPKTLLSQKDPRMPEDRNYIYFPHIAPDRSLLVFAASQGDHDHHTSDYDLFLAALNPDTLEVLKHPVRFTEHPATDRFPEIWVPTDGFTPAPSPQTPSSQQTASLSGEPLFVWEDLNGKREVLDPETLEPGPLRLNRRGLVTYTGLGELQISKGYGIIPNGGTLMGIPENITFQAWVEIVPEFSDTEKVLLSTSDGSFNITASEHSLFVQTEGTDPVEISDAVTPDKPFHLALILKNGTLQAVINGVPENTIPLPSFSPEDDLLIGGTEESPGWQGVLGDIVLLPEALDPNDLRERYTETRDSRQNQQPIPRTQVRARRIQSTPTPTLKEISPYVETLVVHEYKVLETLQGPELPETIRVYHWAILDRQTLPEKEIELELTLEPLVLHPHLQSFNRVDDLPFAIETEEFIDVGFF